MDRVRDDGFHNLYQSERGDKLLAEHDAAKQGNPLEAELREEWNVDRYAFFHLRESFGDRRSELYRGRTDVPDCRSYPAIPGPNDRSNGRDDGHIYRLSNLRTDLDSFTDIEAYALMYDAYCLCDVKMIATGMAAGSTLCESAGGAWNFLSIRALIRDEPRRLLKHLGVGKHQFFKPFLLWNPRAYGAAAALALAAGWLISSFSAVTVLSIAPASFTVGEIASALIVAAIFWILGKLEATKPIAKALDLIRMLRTGKSLYFLYAALAIPFSLVWMGVVVYLKIFDPAFLQLGKVSRRDTSAS